MDVGKFKEERATCKAKIHRRLAMRGRGIQLNPLTATKEDTQNRFVKKRRADQTLKDALLKEQNLAFYTPVKRKKGQDRLTEDEKRFSQKVSRIRQHIEGLFRWIERKTNLSVASQVRSYCFLLAFYS